MKKIIILLCVLFTGVAAAETINITWHNEDRTTYDTTTCNVGDTLVLPTAPTKYGYTFQGWMAYTPIEYLENTGTQYIDTGVLLNGNSKIETKFSCSASGNYAVFGASNGNAYSSGEIAVFWYGNHLDIVKPTSNSTSVTLGVNFGPTIYSGTPIELSYDKSFIKIDNFSYASNWYADYTGVNSMYIFGSHRTTGAVGVGNMRLYHFRLYNGDTLVRNFIPVLDPDGVPCMYDLVTDTCFYNSGTGDFIAGPVIE